MGLGSRYGPRPQVGNSQWTAVVSNSATTGFSRLYFEANRRPARTLHCGVFGVQPGLSKGLQSPRSPCVPAEGQLVDPTVRVVRVERLTALGHQFQYRQGAGERERSCRREAPGARSSTSRLPRALPHPHPLGATSNAPAELPSGTPCAEENRCTVIAGTAEASVVRHRLTHLSRYKWSS
jgi:hypothetical protein